MRRVPAIVAAGDAKAARAVYGESKAYLEVGGRSMVARVVSVLQRVPEVSEVWVVGNAERLEKALDEELLRSELVKPLWIVPQYRNLYENAWYTYRRLLPGVTTMLLMASVAALPPNFVPGVLLPSSELAGSVISVTA